MSNEALQNYFDLACMYLSNKDGSIVTDIPRRTRLLNLLTAHIAQLMGANAGGSGTPGMVGRISDATEGTVTARATYADQTSQSMAWYIQTQYGAMYWQATQAFRTFRYARPRVPACPWPIGRC